MNELRKATPDSADSSKTLWRHAFGETRGLLQVFTGIHDGTGKLQHLKENFFNYPDAVESAAEWALAKSDEGRQVYFCAHLLKVPRRIKENAAKILTLYAEKDGGVLPDGHPPPTAVVE